jgi:hypothetical protein
VYGATVPGGSSGNNGDFYINTSTYYLYGPKASGSWPTGVSLVGPGGGPQGPQGPAGPSGPQGDTGPAGFSTITNTTKTPSSSGIRGEIAYDSFNLYICVTDNSWIRINSTSSVISWT